MVMIIALVSCRFKYGILVIGSGSMTGSIDMGDAVIFERYDGGSIDVGDVIVFNNGDIKTVEDAKKMIDETGCDAIMIGRAALGNPYLFKQVIHYLNTGEKLDDLSDK